jgi:exopolysaccharide biosynthesis polyprenyl glycosylphosphotransferase
MQQTGDATLVSGAALPQGGEPGALAIDPPLLPTTKPEAAESRRRLAAEEQRRRSTVRRREATFKRALAVADAAAMGVALAAGAIVFGNDSLTPSGTLGALLLVILVMKALGLYDRDEHLLHKTTLEELPKLFEVASVSALLLWLGGDLIIDGELGRRQVLGIWLLLIVLFVVCRALARGVARAATPVERCLLLGDAEAAADFRRKISIDHAVKAELVGWLPTEVESNGSGTPPVLSVPAALSSVLTGKDVHRIILAPGRVHGDVLIHAVRKLRTQVVAVSVMPATPQVAGSTVELDDIHGLTLLGVRSFEMGRSSRLLKRGFDLTVSSLALVALLPLLVAVAIAIMLDSRGPVLFRQLRIGHDGKPFEMLKFRSMIVGAHAQREDLRELNEAAEGLFKIGDDPRLTRVGRTIRRWSVDELPQLINVLRGEMSLVGPRPLVPEEDSMIEGLYRRRLDLAPGITGYWQALGSSRIPLFEMVRLDYLYVANWSLWNDVRILFRTVPYVFGRHGR